MRICIFEVAGEWRAFFFKHPSPELDPQPTFPLLLQSHPPLPVLSLAVLSHIPTHTLAGSWECVSSSDPGRGVVMRQTVPIKPVVWWRDSEGVSDPRPHSIFQAVELVDSDVSIDVNMPAAGDTALLGARADPNCVPACGRYNALDGQNALPGVWWAVSASSASWHVFNAVINATTTRGVLATGTFPAAPAPGTWHTLRLVIAGGTASGYLDGAAAFTSVGIQGHVADTGFVGVGTGAWGQHVLFDNFTLKG